jgi:HAD superfamily hydrolase (TIGR01549 family)
VSSAPGAPAGERAPSIVVFDIGEVLVDETRVWAVWAELVGVSPLTFAAVLGAAVAQGEDHRLVFPHVAPNLDWEELGDAHEAAYGGFGEQDLYPDVRPTLEQLRSDEVRVVLAGNQPARRTAQLTALDLPVETIVTSDDLGAEKPDPAFFAGVLELVAPTPASEVLYVGDRVDNDVLPAAAAGMRTCWLRRGPWGQLQELPDDHEADVVLEGLGELPEVLRAWRAEAEEAVEGDERGEADAAEEATP